MKDFGRDFAGTVLLLLLSICCGCGNTAAENQKGSEAGRLIQATTWEEEYLGNVHIGGMEIIPVKEPDIAHAYKRVRQGIVKINTCGLYGSGVIWKMEEEKLIIASNRHLIENWDPKESRITFANGEITGGSPVMLSEGYDLGFIEVDREDLTYEELLMLRAVSDSAEAYEAITEGERIFVTGSADGPGENMYEGTLASKQWYVEEFDTDMILGFCYAVPGMSGGGCFDAKGNFIGMLSGGTGGDEIACLPVTVITDEYAVLEQRRK